MLLRRLHPAKLVVDPGGVDLAVRKGVPKRNPVVERVGLARGRRSRNIVECFLLRQFFGRIDFALVEPHAFAAAVELDAGFAVGWLMPTTLPISSRSLAKNTSTVSPRRIVNGAYAIAGSA